MTQWNFAKNRELVPYTVDPQAYQQLLAELAEILYYFACQHGGPNRPFDSVSFTEPGFSKRDDMGGFTKNQPKEFAHDE